MINHNTDNGHNNCGCFKTNNNNNKKSRRRRQKNKPKNNPRSFMWQTIYRKIEKWKYDNENIIANSGNT